jgi:hypothetical protein
VNNGYTKTSVQKALHGVTVLLFFGALCLPALLHVFGENPTTYITAMEKRSPTSLPEFPATSDELSGYPGKMSAYLDDHFGLREALLNRYTRILFSAGVSVSPKVTLGKDGWMYFDYYDINKTYRGDNPFTETDLKNWTDQFLAYQKWLEERNIPLLLVAIPEKQQVIPQNLPNWLKTGSESRVDQLKNYITRHDLDLTLLDLKSDLLIAQQEDPTFMKTDTHWNQFGAFVGYTAIMDYLKGMFPQLDPLDLNRDVTFAPVHHHNADLARFLYIPEIPEPFYVNPVFEEPVDTVFEKKKKDSYDFEPATPEQAQRRFEVGRFMSELPGQPTLLLVRDSFGGFLLPYFMATFQEMWVAPHSELRNYQAGLVEHTNPDVVVYAFVERYLNTRPKMFRSPDDDIQFGISMSEPKEDVLGNEKRRNVVVSFWVASDEEPDVAVFLNGVSYRATKKDRPDIDARHPNYEFRSGYEVDIPTASFQESFNLLSVLFDGSVFREIKLSLTP